MQWVLGVVGVVLLGVLVDVLLPKGQMSKYVKAIFTVLLIFVLLTPVSALFRQQIPLSSLFDFQTEGYQTDDDYIEIIDNASALTRVQSRYPAVYDLRITSEGVVVYTTGEADETLALYVAMLLGVSAKEVTIYVGR